jgi:LacI family transcriptional regulator
MSEICAYSEQFSVIRLRFMRALFDTEGRSKMKKRKSVALLVERSDEYSRQLLRGIRDFLSINPYWSIYLPEHEREVTPGWLKGWSGDGIISRLESVEMTQAISELGIPIVNLSLLELMPGIPSVTTDNHAVSKMAVEYLNELGYRQFGFCGDPAFRWSMEREQSFVSELQQMGLSCDVYHALPVAQPNFSWNLERERLIAWLQSLRRPCAIFACHDIKAQKILDLCRELSIAVPEEISVLGVDNDELLCDFSDPPLSSIALNTRTVGYIAAEMLTRMMSGQETSPSSVRVPPSEICLRQSSGERAVDDPFVAKALKFIRESSFEGINVTDVLSFVGLSRRSLEHRFVKLLGRTPHEEITRIRISEAKRLLIETNLGINEVAERSGYPQLDYFSAAFKREAGMSPRSFREHARSRE